jgi:hypothetical protein
VIGARPHAVQNPEVEKTHHVQRDWDPGMDKLICRSIGLFLNHSFMFPFYFKTFISFLQQHAEHLAYFLHHHKSAGMRM